jgi:hypothetical protein
MLPAACCGAATEQGWLALLCTSLSPVLNWRDKKEKALSKVKASSLTMKIPALSHPPFFFPLKINLK